MTIFVPCNGFGAFRVLEAVRCVPSIAPGVTIETVCIRSEIGVAIGARGFRLRGEGEAVWQSDDGTRWSRSDPCLHLLLLAGRKAPFAHLFDQAGRFQHALKADVGDIAFTLEKRRQIHV